MKKSSHEFYLYFDGLGDFSVGENVISDKDLVYRLTVVLRFSKDSKICLFNRSKNAIAEIVSINKKNSVTVKIVKIENSKKYMPYITLLLPVLKKNALEDAIYNAVEAGVNEIQLVFTERVQRKFGGEKEIKRLEKIVVAASEQSKNLSVPEIKEPVRLSDFLLHTLSGEKVFFDVDGISFLEILNNTSIKLAKKIYVLIGPEGDLNKDEKELLLQNKFSFVHLTPTILRAKQAVSVSVGLIRTVLFD